MLDGLRQFLFGKPIPPGGVEGIPRDTRDAHHRLHNTAMNTKQTMREFTKDTDDLLELLARDIRRTGGRQ